MPSFFSLPNPVARILPAFSFNVPQGTSNVQTSAYLNSGTIPFVTQQAPHLERWQTTMHQAVVNGRHYP